jgi:hypothetical protein
LAKIVGYKLHPFLWAGRHSESMLKRQWHRQSFIVKHFVFSPTSTTGYTTTTAAIATLRKRTQSDDAQSLCITRKEELTPHAHFCVVPSKRLAKTIQSQNKNRNNNTAQEARNQEEIQSQEERT